MMVVKYGKEGVPVVVNEKLVLDDEAVRQTTVRHITEGKVMLGRRTAESGVEISHSMVIGESGACHIYREETPGEKVIYQLDMWDPEKEVMGGLFDRDVGPDQEAMLYYAWIWMSGLEQAYSRAEGKLTREWFLENGWANDSLFLLVDNEVKTQVL